MMDEVDKTFSWWGNAIKGDRGPITADEPMAGFYRAKAKDGTLSAVAYWYDTNDASLRCQQDGRDIPEMRAREMWPFASRRPITQGIYWHFRDNGKWKDIDEAVQKSPESNPEPQLSEEGKRLELLNDIDSVKDAASKYTKVESDEEMTLAQSVRAKLQELGAKADKLRVAEKEPHLQASRDVDARWQPMIKEAKAAADSVRKAMEGWEQVKRSALRDAQERAEKSKAPVSLPNMPAPVSQVSGGGGRAAHVGVSSTVTAIDIDAVFQQFREDPSLHECLMKLAQKSILAGIPVAGATVEERVKIR